MVSTSQRSHKKELLDLENIPFREIQRNLVELDFINSLLGGHATTLAGVKKILKSKKNEDTEPIHILEIGCGGGDNLAVIRKWTRKNKIQLRLTGVDINAECIEYARQKNAGLDIDFLCSDYKVSLQGIHEKPCIIFSSLFCHHFNDDELVDMISWMKKNSTAWSIY